MKKQLITSIKLSFVLLTMISCSPNPRNILKGAYEKCQSIENGYYEMDKYWKMMSRVDTIKVFQKRYFKKDTKDTIVSFFFNSYMQSPQVGEINIVYTPENLIYYSGNDGFVAPINGYENLIWQVCVKNLHMSAYLPITYVDSRPLPNASMLASDKINVDYVKEEVINGVKCHHMKVLIPEEYEISVLKNRNEITKTEIDFWINKQDSMPIQFMITRDLKMNNQKLVEFEKYVLKKYELNTTIADSLFSLKAVPSNVKLGAVPNQFEGKMLESKTNAPYWSLQTIKGDTLSLSDFNGELVLIDFFIASCPPCMNILHYLDTLYKKYGDKGLNIVGIGCNESLQTLEYFAGVHSIDYPICLGGENLHEAYNISGYPTIYLIDRDGKILFQNKGEFSFEIFEKLESIIKQNINK